MIYFAGRFASFQGIQQGVNPRFQARLVAQPAGSAVPASGLQAWTPPSFSQKSAQKSALIMPALFGAFLKNAPPPFNAAFHKAVREQFINRLPANSAVVLVGNPYVKRANDTDYLFRQDSNFFYLTGLTEPGAFAVLQNKPGAPRFTLIVPAQNSHYETWMGKRAGVEGAQKIYGADVAHDYWDLPGKLPEGKKELAGVLTDVISAVGDSKVQWVPTDGNPKGLRWIPGDNSENNNAMIAEILKAQVPDFSTEAPDDKGQSRFNASSHVNGLRLIKTPYEIELMRRSCKISAKAHKEAIRTMGLVTEGQRRQNPQGRNEGEIQAKVEYYFRKYGSEYPAYPTIAGSGDNCNILHYVTNRDFAKPEDLVLVDAGSEYGGYAADITRTWPIGGKFSEPQKAIYNLVLKAQVAGIEMTKPGVSLKEIHDKCVRVITEGLVELGILKGDVDTLIKESAHTKYFMHQTSHFLGLDVHDVSGEHHPNREIYKNQPLKPGMVFTVEPGIYISKEAAEKEGLDPKWAGIGVRIEDDILVTRDGYEDLSKDVPKTVSEIEALMARKKRK